MGYELYHSAKGSGWKNHKYVSKKTVNGKVRYIYSDSDSSKAKDGYTEFGDWFGSDEADEMTKSAFALGSAKENYENAVRNNRDVRETNRLATKYYLAKKDYDKKKVAYAKTPMGSIERAGTETVKALRNGASWVKKKVKKTVLKAKLKSIGADFDVMSGASKVPKSNKLVTKKTVSRKTKQSENSWFHTYLNRKKK